MNEKMFSGCRAIVPKATCSRRDGLKLVARDAAAAASPPHSPPQNRKHLSGIIKSPQSERIESP